MRIPEHKIEDVLERVDLVNVIGRYVELKKSGRSYKGKCPFHQEKTASFYVTPELQRFKCFGCQAGGDAIAFLQRHLGKTFVDAIQELAREAGVDLEQVEDPSAKERQQLREVTDFASRYFQAQLWHSEKGAGARAYLKSRGIEEATAKQFGLGFALAAWNGLSDALVKEGMLEWALRAGLVQKRARTEGYYDIFRGRLMVPIRSPEARPIAFGGRLLEGSDGPKYLNSRESLLYNKSETLYGLDAAREHIRRTGMAVLVEGYFDCLMLHQVGILSAVALCSTALTPGHLTLLKRAEAKDLVLLLDGDEAGRKAVERLAGPLLGAGAVVKVALLPDGQDPDTFARSVDGGAVSKLLSDAQPLTQHLFTQSLPLGRNAPFEDKMRALERLKPIASHLAVGLTRSAFLGAMALHFGLPATELELSFREKAPHLKPVPKVAPVAEKTVAPRLERPLDAMEAAFAACLFKDPTLLAKDPFRVQDELSHPGLRHVLSELLVHRSAEEALVGASEPLRRALEKAASQLGALSDPLEGYFLKVCRALKLRWIDQRRTYLARLTGQTAQASELNEETRRLLEERTELLELRKRVLEETGPAGTKRLSSPV